MAEDYAWDAPKFRTATGNQRHPGRPACPARALDDAVRAHGAGDQAHRIAYQALKQKFEKRGDHWIANDNPADCGGGEAGQLAAHGNSGGQQIQQPAS
jgi:hypothetical protein